MRALVARGITRLGIFILALGAILFVSSGRLDWGMAWALIGTLLACTSVNGAVLAAANPEVIELRLRRRKGAKGWDVALASSMAAVWFVTLVVAGLDERLGWPVAISLSLRIAALGILVIGDLLFLWAMAVNRFFSRFVEIQRESGHTVATEGPYRHVRHPGYVGWITMSMAIPLILGSLWALIPAGIAIILMLVRTALEDRTLKNELEGYKAYAERVRYRLVPGIW